MEKLDNIGLLSGGLHCVSEGYHLVGLSISLGVGVPLWCVDTDRDRD